MKIHHIGCLQDNYSYLIEDETTKEAAAVDPVEPEKVLEVANSHRLTLKLVLTTHHHWDHAGGNDKMKELVPGIKVYGGSVDNVKGCTDQVQNGDKISFGADITVLALHTPCHTKGHISYYVTGKEDEHPAVFTGDTLYSVKNLQFALTLEPDNLRIQQKLTWAQNQRQAGQPTIPSTIEDEMETNPFMRVDLAELQEKVGCKSPVEALGEIRKRKDNWRG
ncbi:hydroxyacylglutathione hydrolase cytoplasmic-like isoform X2 [Abrus precatorius]|uniref:hydroxyacylglutathione hydrolase n=1 Tax=Abrus precatorius TaxID=3816 RepID=A0A8B8JKJ5_ABRPR|nr:hydroxyacylglutathione hydrolase cytoplasmic-like isoform X2 [Abrus precatorius]